MKFRNPFSKKEGDEEESQFQNTETSLVPVEIGLSPTSTNPSGIMDTGDQITIHLILPNGPPQQLRVPHSSTYGHVRALIAAATGLDLSVLALYRRSNQNEWESLALHHDEVISKVLHNDEQLRVSEYRNGQHQARTNVHHQSYPSLSGDVRDHDTYLQYLPSQLWAGSQSAATESNTFSCFPGFELGFGNTSSRSRRSARTDNDAEMARLLQEEFDQDHAIKTSTQNYENARSMPQNHCSLSERSSYRSTTSNGYARLSHFGRVIARGTKSQYDVPGGESVCTSIAVAVAHFFLSLNSEHAQNPEAYLQANTLDELLMQGATRHMTCMSGHASVDDLWSRDGFSDIAEDLERGLPFTGTANRRDFLTALRNAQQHAEKFKGPCNARVALVVTKPPETILCLGVGKEDWLLVDSHGEREASAKKVFVMKFESANALALALECKFPGLQESLGGNDWQAAMYNSFEATPLARKNVSLSSRPWLVAEYDHATTGEKEEASAEFTIVPMGVEQASSPPHELAHPAKGNDEPGFDPLSPRRIKDAPFEDVIPSSNAPVQALETRRKCAPCTDHSDLSLPVNQNFLDPVHHFLMADPVICEDGNTYDRSTIEKLFEVLEEQSAEIKSPLSPHAVGRSMIPNRTLENEIVRAVESQSLRISENDLDNWKRRRSAKLRRDQQLPEKQAREVAKRNEKAEASLTIDKGKFLDPLKNFLMADPVLCEDGNTYDRSTIEKHFKLLREGLLEIKSPLTLQSIGCSLIPNRTLEDEIVNAVESQAIRLNEVELNMWRQRRLKRDQRDQEKEKNRVTGQRKSYATAVAPVTTDKQKFLDPLRYFLMADPVVCEDGNTYDRSSIEKYFKLLQDESEDIKSPLTSEPISCSLIPDRALEYEIVDAVQSRAIFVTEPELEIWQMRRTEKLERDRKHEMGAYPLHRDQEITSGVAKNETSVLIDKSKFLDPLHFFVMADPVMSEDGHTYDRSTIEKHFQACRHQETGEVTSPLSLEAIGDSLIPNRSLEKEIVTAVGSQAIVLSETERKIWLSRRTAKHKRDLERKQMASDERQRRDAAKGVAVAKASTIDKSQFLDPLRHFLMADPVICEDGHTYDRTTIEKHFKSVQEEEKKMQSKRIQLTSPLSEEIIGGTLIPDQSLEQRIVEAVALLSIEVTDTERQIWLSRRKAKENRDLQRAESACQDEAADAATNIEQDNMRVLVVDKTKFLDPLMHFLMADPVVCEDGFTYDRTVIERHFESRRQEEQARRKGQHNTGPYKNNANSSPSKPIELTSPMTGEVIGDVLLPNRSVEQQIMEAVENSTIDLSETELNSWTARRAEKQKFDGQRETARERKARQQAEEEERRVREQEEERRLREEEAKKPPPKKDAQPYLDPLTYTLMADPVVCDDGNTYDRGVIEQHFETRRREEEARLQTEAGDQDPNGNDGTTCCNAARSQIELTSPLSGNVVSSNLIPNRALEQQIVENVENDELDITEDDKRDWIARREEKRRKDRERAEQARERQAEEERMRQAAEEAEERRRQEAELGITAGQDPATMVRATPSNQTQNHIGVAVSLCEEKDFMPLDYAVSSNRALRCMMSCCKSRMDESDPSWCQRCGRIACALCLSFRVSHIQRPNETESHSICGECAMHVADIMPTNGQLGQARAYMLRLRIAPYAEKLTERAVDLQDAQTRVNAANEFESGMAQLHTDIQRLQQQQTNIRAQIRESERQAERAKRDEGTSGTAAIVGDIADIGDLEGEAATLSQQYQELIQQDVPEDDEDAQIQHIQNVSELSQRLEQLQVRLMMAQSTAEASLAPASAADGEPCLEDESAQDLGSMSHPALQALCARLSEQYMELCQQDMANSDEDAQLQHMLDVTATSNRLEEVQMQIVQSRSMQRDGGGETMTGTTANMPVAQLQQHYQSLQAEYHRLTTSDVPLYTEQEQIAHVVRASELAEQIETIELEITTRNSAGSDTAAFGTGATDLAQMRQLVSQLVAEVRKDRPRSVVNFLGLRSNRRSNAVGELTAAMENMTSGGITAQTVESFKATLQRVQTKRPSNRVDQLKEQINQEVDSLLSRALPNSVPGCTETMLNSSVGSTAAAGSRTESLGSDIVDEGQLLAIGNRDEDWPLPLGLEYPTRRMTNQLEMLQNSLQQSLVVSQRKYDEMFSSRQRQLENEKDKLEDEVSRLRQQASDAQSSAEEEQQRLEERRERARRQEEERRERERQRRERERQAREEAQQLRRRNEADEQATRDALASARGNGGASVFGGRGDLRMCRRCKAGPFENQACSDLGTHNNDRGDVRNANHCRNCGWFNSNWHQWPRWDGIYGPH